MLIIHIASQLQISVRASGVVEGWTEGADRADGQAVGVGARGGLEVGRPTDGRASGRMTGRAGGWRGGRIGRAAAEQSKTFAHLSVSTADPLAHRFWHIVCSADILRTYHIPIGKKKLSFISLFFWISFLSLLNSRPLCLSFHLRNLFFTILSKLFLVPVTSHFIFANI